MFGGEPPFFYAEVPTNEPRHGTGGIPTTRPSARPRDRDEAMVRYCKNDRLEPQKTGD
jgi:hypothetical protein